MMFSSAIRVSLFSVKSVIQSAAELFHEIMSWPRRNGQASEARIHDTWHNAACLPSRTQSHDQKQAATWRAPEEVAQDGNIRSMRSSGLVFLTVGAATPGRPARKPVRSIADAERRTSPTSETLLKGRGKIKVYA